MKLSSRLVELSILFFLVACVHTPAPEPRPETPPSPQRYSIMQGATNRNSTQVNVLARKEENVRVRLSESQNNTEVLPQFTQQKGYPNSSWVVLKFTYLNLKPQEDYTLQILDSNRRVLDSRTLQTLDTSPSGLRFIVASCMDDSFDKEQKLMWENVLVQKPQIIFLIGDNVYADTKGKPADPDTLWMRYVETRQHLELYKSDRLIPIVATWDDHDYGVNDGDRTYPHKKESADIFSIFFSQDIIPGTLEKGPGVASLISLSHQNFFLFDDRSFRSPVGEPDETHWGKDQEDWFFTKLNKIQGPVWLLNGDQFFGKYHRFESYEGRHPKSFKGLLERLKQAKKRVFFVSGDRHLAELMAISEAETGFSTFELTTSAIHARTYPNAWENNPNPRQLVGVSGVMNYALIESNAGKQTDISITAFGPNRQILFSRNFKY